jgi:hypothetical protein
MQKLKRTPPVLLTKESGSVLVGVVVLSIIMAIAGVGFIQATTSSLISETAALEYDRAFQAAESGIWAGARWLRSPENNFPQMPEGATLKPFGDDPVTINGMDVYVTIPVRLIDGAPSASIVAEAYLDRSGAHLKNENTFKKRISVGDVRVENFGTYSTFYGGYQSPDPADTTIRRWHGWGDRTFHGRFHMNNMYNQIMADGEPGVGARPVVFTGFVTIARPTSAAVTAHYQNNYSRDCGGNGHYGNNYDKGIWLDDPVSPWTSVTTAKLDQVFQGRYMADVDPINIDIKRTCADSIISDNSIPATDRILLPLSDLDEGYGPNQYRPTLYIDGATAHYQYREAGMYLEKLYTNFDRRIFCAGNNLNVYTTAAGAKGRFTIATARGCSIVPVGNIVTSDYNPAAGDTAITPASDNMIGLISGKYINFNKTWKKRFAADTGNIKKYVSEQVTGGGSPGPSDGNGTLHVTASIIAVRSFNDVLNGRTMEMKGCEFWDGAWMDHPAYSSTFTNDACHLQDYNYQLYGNHILGGYMNTIIDHKTAGCNGTLNFIHDPRMYKRYLQPPGFPGVSTTENLLVLTMSDWSEENAL